MSGWRGRLDQDLESGAAEGKQYKPTLHEAFSGLGTGGMLGFPWSFFPFPLFWCLTTDH